MTTKLYAAETFPQKCLIFAVIFLAVYVTWRLSPVPKKVYESCDRPCHDLQYPMICRVTLTIDNVGCASGSTNDLAHSSENLIAGPTIHVCQNDVVFVNVINQLEDNFHFQWQDAQTRNSEGVVTNQSNHSFLQYKFRASFPGTHLWSAKSEETSKKLTGALVVRKLPKLNSEKQFYDRDSRNHTIFITECTLQSTKSQLLINGNADFGPQDNYLVEPGLNYRFRLAFGGNKECAVRFTIENHSLKLIEMNGRPKEVNSFANLMIYNENRLDFVLEASSPPAEYKINLDYLCANEEPLSFVAGTLKYQNPEEQTCQKSIEFIQVRS